MIAILIGFVVLAVIGLVMLVLGICNSAGQADSYDEEHYGIRRS